MPSDLTYKIYDGTDTTLKGYLKRIAKEYFHVDSYQELQKVYTDKIDKILNQIAKHENEIEELESKTIEDLIEDDKQNKKDADETLGSIIKNKAEVRQRYLKVYGKLEALQVDSKNANFIGFAQRRLVESIKNDCPIVSEPSFPKMVFVPVVDGHSLEEERHKEINLKKDLIRKYNYKLNRLKEEYENSKIEYKAYMDIIESL